MGHREEECKEEAMKGEAHNMLQLHYIVKFGLLAENTTTKKSIQPA